MAPRGNEIIEDVLFLLQHARVVPFFAILATAAQIGPGKHAAMFDPQEGSDGEDWSQADIKASVTKEQRWIVAVQHQPFLVREKHWHAGAVLRRVEDLRRLVTRRVEVQAYIPEQRKSAAREVVAKNAGRIEERSKVDEHLRISGPACKLNDGAESRQGDFTREAAIEVVKPDLVIGVVHVGHDKLVVDYAGEGDDVVLLRDQLLPLCAFWIAGVDGYDPATRRIPGGMEVEDGAAVADGVVDGIGVVQQANEGAVTIHLAVVNTVFRGGAVRDKEDEIGAIIGDGRIKGEFFEIGPLVDKLILGLGCADPVPVDAAEGVFVFLRYSARLWKAVVKKARVIVPPGNVTELAPFDDLYIIVTVVHVAYSDLLSIAASAGQAIGQQFSVFAGGDVGEGDSAIVAECVGVEDGNGLTCQCLLHIKDGLVLQAGIFGEEVAIAPLLRQRIPGVVP